jgi:hypothetical protein
LQTIIEPERKQATDTANSTLGISVATSSSERNGVVGIGWVIWDTCIRGPTRAPSTHSAITGAKTEQNPYTAELAAIAKALTDSRGDERLAILGSRQTDHRTYQ